MSILLSAQPSPPIAIPLPVVEYYFESAASGQGPTTTENSGTGIFYDLNLVYVGPNPAWTSEATGLGLVWNGTSSKGAAALRQYSPSDALATTIVGSHAATIEVVATLAPLGQRGPDIPSLSGVSQIFGLNKWDAEGDTLSLWIWGEQLIFSCTGGAGVTADSYAALTYYQPSSVGDPMPAGRHVIHAVLDYDVLDPDRRMLFYLDGILIPTAGPTFESVPGNPALGDALAVPAETPWYLSIGGYQNAIYYDGSLISSGVSYASLRSVALSSAQVAARAALLWAYDDDPNP